MIVDVLVLPLWKTTMIMIDLATAAAAAVVVVEVTIDCPSSTKTQKKDKATITTTRILHFLVNKKTEEGTTSTPDYYVVIKDAITRQ